MNTLATKLNIEGLRSRLSGELDGGVREAILRLLVLSQRELQVLSCFSDGHTAKAAARLLHISSRTVEVHSASILKKLEVTKRVQAVAVALQAGVFADDDFMVPQVSESERPMTTAPIMSPLSRGPHHCIGTARAVTDLIFRHIAVYCAARGGSLTSEDLNVIHAQLVDSIVSTNLELIETFHEKCRVASGSREPLALERKAVLSTLLLSRTREAARRAFSGQVSRRGLPWLMDFYDGLADCIRRHVSPTIDGRLFGAYAKLAGRLGANLSMADLLKDDAINFLLCECLAILMSRGAAESMAKVLTDEINRPVAQEGAAKPAEWEAIKQSQMSAFMVSLLQEFAMPLNQSDHQGLVSRPHLPN